MRKRTVIFVSVVLVLAGLSVIWRMCARHSLPVPDPVATAHAETEMWKAYYAGDRGRLVLKLARLLHSQFGLSVWELRKIAEHLGNASMNFKFAEGDYATTVLPDLEKAYQAIRSATGASFDARQVAEAELSWWVARRTPGRNRPEQVGREIAKLYELLYGAQHASLEEAGVLRARAASLRDAGRESADWVEVERLLAESYRLLEGALVERTR